MLAIAMVMMPFLLKAQNAAEPVADVVATKTSDSNVEVLWSWDKIVPEMLTVDFETGDFSQAGFFNDPTSPWIITDDAYEGNFAIKSTCEGVANGVSAIEITVDVPFDATMSFYHKVDCEYYFDNARFFIDGVERALITGNIDWEYKEFKITKGVHTYRWTYRKDSDDYGVSTDAYFVDNIVLYKKALPFDGGWIYYDDGHYVDAVGSETGTIDWGICFPDTEKYAGYKLTKVAIYDKDPLNLKANVYFGGEDAPATKVTSENVKLTGSEQMVEFELATALPIDGTEPLWITFSCTDPYFAATACNYVDEENSDWISFDGGVTWEHLAKHKVNYSWMIRGYLQNDRGETVTLDRAFNDYKVYRTNLLTEEVELLAENVTETSYNDATWAEAEYGVYKWGVAATYDEGDAEIVWSNAIDKDMFTSVNVEVTANNYESVAGAKVRFKNNEETNYKYSLTLDEKGVCQLDRIRKGTYKFSVSLNGYEDYVEENVEIVDATSLACVLMEIKAAVENLYVSPTGWAMWENASFENAEGTFFFDFENGKMDGWKTVDADGDGFNWKLTTDIMGPGYGHNGSKYCVVSQSYDMDSVGPLTPDNYLITTEKYLITENSQLTYYVCAQDENEPAEHYAVLVSTASNTEMDDFETVWEETMSRGNKATKNSRAQGAWYKRVIDLSKYAGQEVYVAFRHFNSMNQFYIDIDDIALVNNAKSSRTITGYTVKLNDEIVSSEVMVNHYQFENLEAGKTYTASVVANYTTGDSEAVEYTWTAASTDDYAGTTNFTGRSVAGKVLLQWSLEGDQPQDEVESSFSFDFNDGTLNGWRNIDADGDSLVWYNSAEKLGPGYGYKDSLYCIVSHSFYSGEYNYSVTPDNYLVTEKKYAITENSKLSFVVCAQDPSWYEEHYGVAITLIDNATAEDFIMVWEETIESDDTDFNTPQTDWEKKTIDLSQYAGEEIYIALRHFNCTDQYMIDIDNVTLMSGTKSNRSENEALGVMLYCEGELLNTEPITKRSCYAEFPGYDEYEYCVRVVYSDYSMSAAQCITVDAPMQCDAPTKLYGELTENQNGETGVSLTWPYKAPLKEEWLHYDNGTPTSALGMNGNPFYWAIMIPASKLVDYAGTSITKVMTFDVQAGGAAVLVSYGSLTQPGAPLIVENFSYEGTSDWKEITLSQPIPVTGEDNIWVMIYQVGTLYPAAICSDAGDPNGRWCSTDGTQWKDVNTLGSNISVTWVLRAFVTNEADRSVAELKEIDFKGETSEEFNISFLDEPIAVTANRESTLDHYNVYRGFDLDDMEVIAETKEGNYFDVVGSGRYYYQVTAVYTEGEDSCESEPAGLYGNPSQKYVVVEVLGIDENGVNGFMMYPNPTRDALTINAESMSRITIANALGQIVLDKAVDSDNEVIDMSRYDAGMYIVRIMTENGAVVRKVSKL